MSRPIPDRAHGTSGGYCNWGCRCAPCVEANRTKQRRWRASRVELPIPNHVHGTDNGYVNYGCRCDPCTSAHTDNKRSYLASRSRREQA